jgi:hypothetical protein
MCSANDKFWFEPKKTELIGLATNLTSIMNSLGILNKTID